MELNQLGHEEKKVEDGGDKYDRRKLRSPPGYGSTAQFGRGDLRPRASHDALFAADSDHTLHVGLKKIRPSSPDFEVLSNYSTVIISFQYRRNYKWSNFNTFGISQKMVFSIVFQSRFYNTFEAQEGNFHDK